MDEIVRAMAYDTRKMPGVSVRRPLGAVVAGVVSLLAGLAAAGVLGLAAVSWHAEGVALSGEDMEGLVYLVVSTVAIIGGGLAILLRRYKAGGLVVLAFAIMLSFGFWYFGIPAAIAGIVALRAEEKLEDSVVSILRTAGALSLSDIAGRLKKSEADVEIAIRRLQKGGVNIAFDEAKRQACI